MSRAPIHSSSPSITASRLGLLGTFVLIAAITIVALAPQQWAVVASMAVTEGLPLVAWLLAGYGFGSLILCSAGDAASATILTHVTRITLGLGVISLATLLLGVVGLLSQFTAVAIVLIGASIAVSRSYNNRNTILTWLRKPPGAAWLLLLIAPVAGIIFLGDCILPGLLWGLDDPSGYDVVAYHLQLPREWFELGRITTLGHNVFSFFPLNVEMHYLLAMHLRGGPWAGVYLAQMMHGSSVLLTLAAVYGTVRPYGQRAASVAAIVCASVPWMTMLGSVAYVEGGLLLYATLAMAWAIRRRWALAGACAGFACGCKLTGVPLTAMIAAVSGSLFLWERVRVRAAKPANDDREPQATSSSVRPHPSPLPEGEGAATALRGIARDLSVFAAMMLLVFSPWLIRTAIASHGNTIFPLAMRTLGHGHFDVGQIERFEVAHAPRDDQRSLNGRFAAFKQQIGNDYHYGAIAFGKSTVPALLIVLLVASVWLIRSHIAARRELLAWLVLIVGSVGVWLFVTHLQGRFLVQVIPFAAIAIGIAASTSAMFTRAVLAFSVVGFVLAMRAPLATYRSVPPQALGVENLTGLLPESIASAVYDSKRPIYLIGDAKAFWYSIPSSRLHYRSVFDVPSAKSFRDAWLGDNVPSDAIVIVDPGELNRFARTYRNLPPIPNAWRDRTDVFAINAVDVPK